MSEHQLQGPDLTLGISEQELSDGAMLTGHSQGESVLLARRGDEVFAIGATCSHYSAPLGDGIITGHMVRCPWHHACFDLRTGAALRAPALAPVSVWRVDRVDGQIFVREKIPAARLQTRRGPRSVAIIGAGAAGTAVADTLRREGYGGEIVLISSEQDLPYDKPNLSKDYLAGKAPADWIPLHPAEYYDANQIRLMLATRVTAIDPKLRQLTFANGIVHEFDALVIATGAIPRRLDVPGGDLPHVHYLRTFADSRRLHDALSKDSRVVVVGSSFIGLEVAASLREREVSTTVVSPDELPLERVLGPELGDFIKKLHQKHGVEFRLGPTVRSIDPTHVTLTDGERIPADIVVVGIGVVPEVSLARNAGLAVDNGIVVNEYLETSHPGIFAAGDLARWPDRRSGEPLRVEHWVVAGRQGQTVARNILGFAEKFDAVPFFWSQHYDVKIRYVGHAIRWDEVLIDGSLESRDATIAYRDRGRIAAVATIRRDRVSLQIEAAIEAGEPQELEALNQFADRTTNAGDSASRPKSGAAASAMP
jgi:NADPH-dependent 2,4-dienoyl-CoA reductase/sulfur reductase-like enzyme/nitrite reductase/ring-hydroxylating ferredoxin subunit